MGRRVLACVVIAVLGVGVGAACGAFSGSDAASDPDASTGDSGGGDGGLGLKPAFCATVDATFCDDFDEHALGVGWNSIDTTDGSFLALDDAAFTSPTRSLVSDDTKGSPGLSYNIAQLSKFVGAPPRHLRCELDVRAAPGAGRGLVWLFNGEHTSAEAGYENFNLYLYYDVAGAYVQSAWSAMGVTATGGGPVLGLDMTSWNRLRLDLTLNDKACFGEIEVSTLSDGAVTSLGITPVHTGPDAGCTPKDSSQIVLGLANAPGWRINFDNVACTWSN